MERSIRLSESVPPSRPIGSHMWEYPTGKTRWPMEEYIAWRKRPPEEREQEYRMKLLHEARDMRKRKAN